MIEFNRRRDRRLGDYLYISDAELWEQGITAHPVDIVGRHILYNGEKMLVTGASNDGIIFGQSCTVTDEMFYRFIEGHPVFKCPCGKHNVDPVNYAYCTQGSGRVYYQLKSAELLAWFKKNGKQHLII